MVFTLETKLHILLIMTVIGIALYMYLLYKEIKIFQEELNIIKSQMLHIQQASFKDVPITSVPIPEPPAPKPAVVEDDDDNDSVTSNEIKRMLTNINNDDDHVEIDDEEKPESSTIAKDMFSMSSEDLSHLECKDLREFLRDQKLNTKGTKAEMIKRIIAYQEVTATNVATSE